MAVTRDNMTQEFDKRSLWATLSGLDWVFAALVIAGAGFVLYRYAAVMDVYEIIILSGVTPAIIALGWHWKAVRGLLLAVTLLSLASVGLYGDSLAPAETSFLLKFLISSQSAIMWMSALFVLATVTYFAALFLRSDYAGRVASVMTWSAATMGLTGLMVRWRESYLVHVDYGHIPISNLYEVFVLFSIITALLYLYYEGRYKTRALGGFVLLIISAAVGFVLWYIFKHGGSGIAPLVPALQSYWMKIHVPANFIGYGSFSLAAMVGTAYLLRERAEHRSPNGLLATRLPTLDVLDDVMYKAITLGFGFFTLATILGALWAAEAWGGYWSWDPKETWALIVLLNYAAWLHMRFSKGWRGRPMAWWAVGVLFITLFAFMGVILFLSGMHSYGSL